jgi:membrane-bound ClpP family serine protease
LQLSEPDINLNDFLGKEGVTNTPLKPIGYVDFNGSVLQVSAGSGFVPEKTKVVVSGLLNDTLIVRPAAESALESEAVPCHN